MTYAIEFEPSGLRLLCNEPQTIADAIHQAGVSLRSECGGKGVCGKCLVHLETENHFPITEAERHHLTPEQIAGGWRLACRTVVSTDSRVFIPAVSQAESQFVQVEGLFLSFIPAPAVRVLPLTVQPATLQDQAADLERVSQALFTQHGVEGAWAGLPALQGLSQALRQGNWQVSLALHGSEIIAAYPLRPPRPLGLAVDVGTTKIACYLVDLETGRTLAAAGQMNPQIAFGEDVMSRLESVLVDPANASRLQQEVIEAINTCSAAMCAGQGLSQEHILDACLVGNTAMHHLFAHLPIRPLALVPFVPVVSSALEVEASSLGLRAAPGARAYLPPPVAGFVGSDHLAFLMAAEFDRDPRTRIGIDIGTNTEIALQAGGRIVSCSTASGPAFEGAHIRHGMRAAPGAIEHVFIDECCHACCSVIGGGDAIGICGSGILDVLAEMRRTNIINERGRMLPGAPSVVFDPDGAPFYPLIDADGDGRSVVITQHDVDQVLLAKGALRTGIEILLNRLNIPQQDIEEVVIAGAFGTFLDPASAVRIGLLPSIPLDRVRAVGNAAGSGARLLLASTEFRSRAQALARRIEYLELTIVPGFNRYFAQGVRLPPL